MIKILYRATKKGVLTSSTPYSNSILEFDTSHVQTKGLGLVLVEAQVQRGKLVGFRKNPVQ